MRYSTNQEWIQYFQANRRRLMPIAWERGVCFTPDETKAVAASLQEFQLGESGEGRHFRACAERYATASGDHAYCEALALFIAEEQRHAEGLGRVMDLAGIERASGLPVDTVFRHARRLLGLELMIVLLVTAEIVAQVYYKALRDATGSVVLKTLCRQILRDEVQHVRFQCQQLAKLRAKRWKMVNGLAVAAHHALLLATALLIWRKHGPVMRRAGIGLGAFVARLSEKMRVARRCMRPAEAMARALGPACKLTGRPIQPVA